MHINSWGPKKEEGVVITNHPTTRELFFFSHRSSLFRSRRRRRVRHAETNRQTADKVNKFKISVQFSHLGLLNNLIEC